LNHRLANFPIFEFEGEMAFLHKDYCMVLLKQHANGWLAYMPLYKHDFIQSKNNELLNKLAKVEKDVESKIKFSYSYHCIGQKCKVNIKCLSECNDGSKQK
jgi:hypothetical protein